MRSMINVINPNFVLRAKFSPSVILSIHQSSQQKNKDACEGLIRQLFWENWDLLFLHNTLLVFIQDYINKKISLDQLNQVILKMPKREQKRLLNIKPQIDQIEAYLVDFQNDWEIKILFYVITKSDLTRFVLKLKTLYDSLIQW